MLSQQNQRNIGVVMSASVDVTEARFSPRSTHLGTAVSKTVRRVMKTASLERKPGLTLLTLLTYFLLVAPLFVT